MAGLDELKRSLSDWCAAAADRTAEAAKVTTRQYDKFAIGREIEKRLAELGGLVCEGLTSGRADLLDDPRVAELVAAVRGLEEERAAKEGEIAGIRQENAGRRQDAGQMPPRTGSEIGAPHPEFSD